MTYVLHNRLGSGGFAVEAVLELGQLDYRMALIESTPSTPLPESFRTVNSWGQVPVLDLPKGGKLTESAAILIYLAQKHKSVRDGAHLAIGDQAAFLRWTVFLGTNVYEGTLRRSYPARYHTSQDRSFDENVAEAALNRNHAAFQVLETVLAQDGFLTGERLSSADVFLAMFYAWHRRKPDLPECTRVTSTVARHPVVAPIWRRNFSHRLDEDWTQA